MSFTLRKNTPLNTHLTEASANLADEIDRAKEVENNLDNNKVNKWTTTCPANSTINIPSKYVLNGLLFCWTTSGGNYTLFTVNGYSEDSIRSRITRLGGGTSMELNYTSGYTGYYVFNNTTGQTVNIKTFY